MKNKLEFLTDQKAHRWEKFETKVLTHHRWNKHSLTQTPTWYWQKFNANSKNQYLWDKYEVHVDKQYTWDKWATEDRLIKTDYYWNRHLIDKHPCYPSWESKDYYKQTTWFYDKYGVKYSDGELLDTSWRLKLLEGTMVDIPAPGVVPHGDMTSRYPWGSIIYGAKPVDVDERENSEHYWIYSGVWADCHTMNENGSIHSRAVRAVGGSIDEFLAAMPSHMTVSNYPNSGHLIDGLYLDTDIDNSPMFAIESAFENKESDKYASQDLRIRIYSAPPELNRTGTTEEEIFASDKFLLQEITTSMTVGTMGSFDKFTVLPTNINAIIQSYFSTYPTLFIVILGSELYGNEDFYIATYSSSPLRVFRIERGCECRPFKMIFSESDPYGWTRVGYVFTPFYTQEIAITDVGLLGLKELTSYGKYYDTIPFHMYLPEERARALEVDLNAYYGCVPHEIEGLHPSSNYFTLNEEDYFMFGSYTRLEFTELLNVPAVYYTTPGILHTGRWEIASIELTPNGLNRNLNWKQNGEDLYAFYRGPAIVKGLIKDPNNLQEHMEVYEELPEGLVGDYWYELIKVENANNYYMQSIFLGDADTSAWTPCASVTFNLQTGERVVTEGEGEFFIPPDSATTYYRRTEWGVISFYILPLDGESALGTGEWMGPQEEDSKYIQDKSVILKYNYYPGQFLEIVTREEDSLPHDGYDEESYYVFKEKVDTIEHVKTEYLGEENVLNDRRYPDDGYVGGYWYKYKSTRDLKSPGQHIGIERADVPTAWPQNGIVNNVWYTYKKMEIVFYKGKFIETIISTAGPNMYPQSGKQGNYWYVFEKYQLVPTISADPIGLVDSTDPDRYPKNDKLGDYWYIYLDSYDQRDRTIYIEDVWNDNSTAYPNDGVEGDFWYRYTGYKYIPQYIINDRILKGGVKYKQEVNTSEDYVPGDVACAEIQFTIFTEPKEAQKYLDLECDYYCRMRDEDSWELVGHFTVTEASDRTSTTTKLKAYDNVIKTEKIVDSVIKNTKYPISLTNLYTAICDYCGVSSYVDTSAINRAFQIKNNFTTNQITARQVLALIAEVAAGFVMADPDGRLVLRGYKDISLPLDLSAYKDTSKAIYSVQKIDKLNVAKSTDDLGVSYGDGNIVYRIIDNPLLYIQDEHEIDTQLRLIYNVVSQVQYVPMDINTFETFGIHCGDIITVDGETAYVMSMEWDGSKIAIKSKGQRERTVEKNPIDGSIDALRGKSNELKRTLDETNSRITNVQAGLKSEIKQTADSLTATITNTKEDLESQLSLTADSLTATISNNKEELEGKLSLTATEFQTQITDTKKELQSSITQTANSITSQVTQQGNVVTEISQRLDGIKLTYNSSNGTASITIGDITVSNLVNGEYVQSQVAGIDMTGYVRFNDLERRGSTVINGSNITTGTIDADRINLSGAISFSDLNSSLQAQISGGSGGGTTDPVTGLPDYIKNTYIDATTIYSPKIVGGKLIAGDSSRGYCEMTSGGLNVCASSGSKPIIGLGHLTEHYNEPFITLGVGVDSYGTNAGMIKKYSQGIWIGDNDDIDGTGSTPSGGTGIFINFNQNRVYKYINGTATAL